MPRVLTWLGRRVRRLRIALRFAYTLWTWPLHMLAHVLPFGVAWVHRLRGVRIGAGCIIPKEVFIDDMDPYLVSIGRRVVLAPGVRIFAHTHHGEMLLPYAGPRFTAPVELRDGCYVGANAVILPGVTVGECALVAAGAVVREDVPPLSVAAGVPARVVKTLERAYDVPPNADLYDVFFTDPPRLAGAAPRREAPRRPARASPRPERIVLSIDVEARGGANADEAGLAEIERETERMLSTLEAAGSRATLFFVGRLAERRPGLVRRALEAGCEVGSHSHEHRLVTGLTREAFREDLARSMGAVAAVAGEACRLYRAPAWSLTWRTPWFGEELERAGVEIDSSLMPLSTFDPPAPFRFKGSSLVEMPPSVNVLLRRRWLLHSGIMFRVLPYGLVRLALRAARARRGFAHLAFHPWEMAAPESLPAGLSRSRRWFYRHGAGESARRKFGRLVREFPGAGVAETARALELPEWPASRIHGWMPPFVRSEA